MLKVRVTPEWMAQLDAWRGDRTRSEAVRFGMTIAAHVESLVRLQLAEIETLRKQLKDAGK